MLKATDVVGSMLTCLGMVGALAYNHRQLVVSIPRLTASSCHLLGKINAMGTLFSMRQLCLQSKWPTITEITDVTQRPKAVYGITYSQNFRSTTRGKIYSSGSIMKLIDRFSLIARHAVVRARFQHVRDVFNGVRLVQAGSDDVRLIYSQLMLYSKGKYQRTNDLLLDWLDNCALNYAS